MSNSDELQTSTSEKSSHGDLSYLGPLALARAAWLIDKNDLAEAALLTYLGRMRRETPNKRRDEAMSRAYQVLAGIEAERHNYARSIGYIEEAQLLHPQEELQDIIAYRKGRMGDSSFILFYEGRLRNGISKANFDTALNFFELLALNSYFTRARSILIQLSNIDLSVEEITSVRLTFLRLSSNLRADVADDLHELEDIFDQNYPTELPGENIGSELALPSRHTDSWIAYNEELLLRENRQDRGLIQILSEWIEISKWQARNYSIIVLASCISLILIVWPILLGLSEIHKVVYNVAYLSLASVIFSILLITPPSFRSNANETAYHVIGCFIVLSSIFGFMTPTWFTVTWPVTWVVYLSGAVGMHRAQVLSLAHRLTNRGFRPEIAAKAVGIAFVKLIGAWVPFAGMIYAIPNLTDGFFDYPLITKSIILCNIVQYVVVTYWCWWEEGQENLRARLEMVILSAALYTAVLTLRIYRGEEHQLIIGRMAYLTGLLAIMLYVSMLKWNVGIWSYAAPLIVFLVVLNWSFLGVEWWIERVPVETFDNLSQIMLVQQGALGLTSLAIAIMQLVTTVQRRRDMLYEARRENELREQKS